MLITAMLLAGCGGNSSSTSELAAGVPPTQGKSTSDSNGQFIIPINQEVFAGNIRVGIQVQDLDGIKNLSLSFNQNAERHLLCSSADACSGTNFTGNFSAIYPGQYAVEPGPLVQGL